MDESREQLLIRRLLIAGAAMMGVGAVLIIMSCFSFPLVMLRAAGLSPVLFVISMGPLIFAAGIFTALGGLGYGLWLDKHKHEGSVTIYPNVWVLARYAFNREGDMITNFRDMDIMEGLRFYVRLDLGNGRKDEFECAWEVFVQAAEGMYGDAVCQGKWLSSFRANLGIPEDQLM